MFKLGDWLVCIPLKKVGPYFKRNFWNDQFLIFTGLPMEEPGIDGWSTLFITRPRVNFINEFLCVISQIFEFLISTGKFQWLLYLQNDLFERRRKRISR